MTCSFGDSIFPYVSLTRHVLKMQGGGGHNSWFTACTSIGSFPPLPRDLPPAAGGSALPQRPGTPLTVDMSETRIALRREAKLSTSETVMASRPLSSMRPSSC